MDLDKDRFVREIDTAVREHGHQVFFAVEKGGTMCDIIRDHHLFMVLDVINSMTHRMDTLNLDADCFDQYERATWTCLAPWSKVNSLMTFENGFGFVMTTCLPFMTSPGP
jgi:hypothetical protein